ncbi:MAG: ATP-binding protein [Myxococcota bacterium]|nr:ATP-binding protein [Myxococcota bacterium]
MTGRLSIGARWTLRFTGALLVTVSIFAGILYAQVSARTQHDARVFLALRVKDLATAVDRDGIDSEATRNALIRSVRVGEADFKLGLQLFDENRALLVRGGSLERHPQLLPRTVPEVEPSAVLAEQTALFSEHDVGENYPYLLMTLPVEGGVAQGFLYQRQFVRAARDLRNQFLYTAPMMLLIVAGMGYLLARGSLQPIKDITATAQRISGTHMEETIPTSGSRDELDELAGTLNAMMDRVREGFARTRRFSANAAHELRTPLNRMRGRLEVTLEKERTPDEYREALGDLMHDVEHLSEGVHGLMRLAQSEAGLSDEQRVDVDLSGLLMEVTSFFEPLADEKRITLDVADLPPITVPGDPSWLHQVFANLVHNAIKYTPEGGTVSVEAAVHAGDATVVVRDTGIGIAPEEAERIFEPFHRVGAKPDAPGVGLGLPLARELVRAHGGALNLMSGSDGSDFVVRLPTRSA